MDAAAVRRFRRIAVGVTAIVWLVTTGCSLEPGSAGLHAEHQPSSVSPSSPTSGRNPSIRRVPSETSVTAPPPPSTVPLGASASTASTASTSTIPVALLPTTVPAQQIPPTTAPLSGCAAAILYLERNAAPGFRFVCPGDALGHQAMTCVNSPATCPNQKVIVIADPTCAPAIMNEALNSWTVTRQLEASLDAYGHC